MLENHYRCYGNPKDKIHLGFNGIRELARLITQNVSLVDARSYRAVVQSNIRLYDILHFIFHILLLP